MKAILRQQIDAEHGNNYSRNIKLSGYIVKYGDTYIAFDYNTIKGKEVVVISYINATSANALINVLYTCIKMWETRDVKFTYTFEHRRKANYVSKYLKPLGFEENHYKKTNWKYDWVSDNGYDESDVIELYS